MTDFIIIAVIAVLAAGAIIKLCKRKKHGCCGCAMKETCSKNNKGSTD